MSLPGLFLHQKQMSVFRARSRFKVVVAGRRWGKSQLAKTAIVKYARVAKRLVWYVAPSYRMAKQIMWPELLVAIPRRWIKKINETTMSITLVNHTRIELKGADNPDSLRGVGVHYLVMDEVQDIDQKAWTEVLRPTLASTGGHALFIGCVRGNTRVLTRRGITKIEDFSTSKKSQTLESLHCDLYGINRSFHAADGFWNNGVVKTKKIKTHMGFEIEASEPHPMMVMGKDGNPVWKRADCIEAGDRIAIARGMELWPGDDPLAGLEDHLNVWHKQFEGKRGPKPKRLAA